MHTYLIMTILGSDRPGLVNSLAETVARHGGNWLECRMTRLAGQFAGIVRVECPHDHVDALLQELQCPSGDPAHAGLTVQAARESIETPRTQRTIDVEVVGNDRPGIVREITAAIASSGGNIEEISTNLESAPMSGHPIFRAKSTVSIPESIAIGNITEAIENLGGDLSVDVTA